MNQRNCAERLFQLGQQIVEHYQNGDIPLSPLPSYAVSSDHSALAR